MAGIKIIMSEIIAKNEKEAFDLVSNSVTGKSSFSSRDYSICSNKLYKNLSIANFAEDAVVTGKVSELSDKQCLVQRFPGSNPGHGASALLIMKFK